jgi:hypothetical protein
LPAYDRLQIGDHALERNAGTQRYFWINASRAISEMAISRIASKILMPRHVGDESQLQLEKTRVFESLQEARMLSVFLVRESVDCDSQLIWLMKVSKVGTDRFQLVGAPDERDSLPCQFGHLSGTHENIVRI